VICLLRWRSCCDRSARALVAAARPQMAAQAFVREETIGGLGMRDFVLTCGPILTRTLLLIALILGLALFLATTVLREWPALRSRSNRSSLRSKRPGGFRKIPTDTLAHRILIPVKVTARPLAASCHPVSPHDGFQSHEGTANTINRREFIEGAPLVAGSVAVTGALAFAG